MVEKKQQSTKQKPTEQEEKVEAERVVEYTRYAISTFQEKSTGFWRVVMVPFNPETGDVGPLEVVPANETDRENIRNLFRKKVVEKEIL